MGGVGTGIWVDETWGGAGDSPLVGAEMDAPPRFLLSRFMTWAVLLVLDSLAGDILKLLVSERTANY